jgi:ABC-2 type transport system ATP-binding protein
MTERTEVAVSVRGLKKTFKIGFFRKKIPAVVNSTFEVRRGEIFGLIGPNGAGKTTTMKMILGLIAPDEGEGTIFGESIRSTAARARVGFLPETPSFYDYLKPSELLDYYGELYGLDRHTRRRRIPELLELVGLQDATQKQLRKFSKGMLQRIGLAQALLPDSDLVILDEPQSGLDPMGRKDVRDIIVSLRDRGKTVLFSSHVLPDVELICDRVAIIVRGQVTKTGRLNELVDTTQGTVEVVLRRGERDLLPILGPLCDRCDTLVNGEVRAVLPDAGDVDAVLRTALEAGAQVRSVERHRARLEDVFMAEARGGAAP